MSHDSEQRIDRIERVLEKVVEGLELLARVDERVITQAQTSKSHEVRIGRLERRTYRLELSRAKLLGAVMVVSGIGSLLWPYVETILRGSL